ncbi:MAG: response regulator [Actinobacteria bacterium]|nr:response regulator [Actinomycetota bacterium]
MTRPHVLLVDDEPDVRLLVRVVLSAETIEVVEASTGDQALETLENEKIDGVVLDWMMPGVSGLEVLQRVRNAPDLAAVPIIMLTGIAEERLPEAVAAGADWILRKPFHEEDLLEAMYALFPPEPARAATSGGSGRAHHGPDSWIDFQV